MKKLVLLVLFSILFIASAIVRIIINLTLVPYFIIFGFRMMKNEKHFSSVNKFREFVDSLGVDLSTLDIELLGNGGTQALQ